MPFSRDGKFDFLAAANGRLVSPPALDDIKPSQAERTVGVRQIQRDFAAVREVQSVLPAGDEREIGFGVGAVAQQFARCVGGCTENVEFGHQQTHAANVRLGSVAQPDP